MAHNGQLIRTGMYEYVGRETYALFAQVMHSETGEIYFLLACPAPLGISFQQFNSQNPTDFVLQRPCVFPDIAHYLDQEEFASGTYEHYKSTPEDKKLYNVLGTAKLLSGEIVVIYHPLYGQQALMARPLYPVDPAVDDGSFAQAVAKPGYTGPRFTRVGGLTT
jgi:hypothetical protein